MPKKKKKKNTLSLYGSPTARLKMYDQALGIKPKNKKKER